jgi:hypothetical protein
MIEFREGMKILCRTNGGNGEAGWHNNPCFIPMSKDKNNHNQRNAPAGEGRGNDPHIRDESAQQPGTNTISSDTDGVNQQPTKTAADGFKTPFGDDADPAFDDIGNADDNR